MKIALTGACLSGNLGGEALYLSVVNMLNNKYNNSCFYVMSKAYKDDKNANTTNNMHVLNFSTLFQLLIGVPFFLLAGLLRLLHIPNKWCAVGALKVYAKCDMVVDCSGIAYTDDRSFTGLIINTLWFLPAFAYNVPVYKMSQQLGPFNKWYVKVVAKLILTKIKVLVCRGDISYKYTKELLPNYGNIYNLPDLAFSLPKDENEELLKNILQSAMIQADKEFVVFSPSTVVQNKLGNEKYTQLFLEIAKKVKKSNSNYQIVFLPHSRAHSKQVLLDSSSDDINICNYIYREFQKNEIECYIIKGNYSATILKAVIAKSKAVFCSRYHCMIAALSCGVPTFVISWSHKYYETMKLFDMQKFVIDNKKANKSIIGNFSEEFLYKLDDIKNKLSANLPKVILLSNKNIDYIDID